VGSEGAERSGDRPLRGLPWLGLLLCLALAVGWAATRSGSDASHAAAARALAEAERLFAEHPHLEPPEALLEFMGRERAQRLAQRFEREWEARGAPPIPEGVIARRQARLDAEVAEARRHRRAAPQRRYGLSPPRPGADGETAPPVAWAAHAFLPPGAWQLAGDALGLFLLAAFLEGAWGCALFGAVFAGSLGAGAAGHWLFGTGVLLGPAGGLAGLLAAFAVRFRPRPPMRGERGEVPFRLVLGAGAVWLALLTLFGGAGFSLPAVLAGAAFGAGAAALVALLGIEESVVGRRRESRLTLVTKATLERALRAREAGRLDEALVLLRQAVREDPGDIDAALALYDVALERGRTGEAATAMLRVVRWAVRRGDAHQAALHWRELDAQGLAAAAEPTLSIRMAKILRDEGAPRAAVNALRHALERAGEGARTSVAARVAHAAEALDPETATEAAWRALGSLELEYEDRVRLEDLLGRLREAPEQDVACVELSRHPATPRRRRDEPELPPVEDLSDRLAAAAAAVADGAPPKRRRDDGS